MLKRSPENRLISLLYIAVPKVYSMFGHTLKSTSWRSGINTLRAKRWGAPGSFLQRRTGTDATSFRIALSSSYRKKNATVSFRIAFSSSNPITFEFAEKRRLRHLLSETRKLFFGAKTFEFSLIATRSLNLVTFHSKCDFRVHSPVRPL